MLQPRREWPQESRNLEEGDLVLQRRKETPRNSRPLGRITHVYPSADSKVQKVELETAKDGPTRGYTRPVTEVILLKTEKDLVKMKTSVG